MVKRLFQSEWNLYQVQFSILEIQPQPQSQGQSWTLHWNILLNPDPDLNPVFRPGPTGLSVAITSERVQIQFQLKFNIIVSENNGINLYWVNFG